MLIRQEGQGGGAPCPRGKHVHACGLLSGARGTYRLLPTRVAGFHCITQVSPNIYTFSYEFFLNTKFIVFFTVKCCRFYVIYKNQKRVQLDD